MPNERTLRVVGVRLDDHVDVGHRQLGPDVVNIFFTSSIPLVISLRLTEKFMADRRRETRVGVASRTVVNSERRVRWPFTEKSPPVRR